MNNQRTIAEVDERVELEGLGYAVMWYIGRELNSTDEILNEEWATAHDALHRIERRIDNCRQQQKESTQLPRTYKEV